MSKRRREMWECADSEQDILLRSGCGRKGRRRRRIIIMNERMNGDGDGDYAKERKNDGRAQSMGMVWPLE